jgi:peptide chain release factor 3
LQEGVVQSFELESSLGKASLLGAVGPLQFEVVQYRLETEYGAESSLEPTPYIAVRWIRPKDSTQQSAPVATLDTVFARDSDQNLVVLFQTQWSIKSFSERNSAFDISDVPFSPDSAGEATNQRN